MVTLMKKALVTALLMAVVSSAGLARAQYATPPPAPNGQILDGDQLNQLLGPIALYPDPLIAEILPAATQPSQIALAENYVSQNGDPNGIDSQPWDGSVKAIARYPDVLKMMSDDLAWTSELGQAFLNQPTDVMNAIQSLRAQAQGLGNLASGPQETVVTDDGDIEIVPTDPDLLYVPEYDPGIIFYQRGYGRSFFRWGIGFHIGAWLNHDFDWHDHHVVVWGHDHPRPANWWREPAARRHEDIAHNTVWHGGARGPGRPGYVARGDRGFAPRPEPARPAEPPRGVRPGASQRPEPVRSEPVRPEPARPVAPRPEPARPVVQAPPRVVEPPRAPVVIHSAPVAPSRPSAFGGGSSAQIRAASSRGAVSRGPAGGGGGRSPGKR